MIYRSYTPSLALAELVDRFWTCSDAPSHHRERILPSGTVELVLNLREDEIRIYDSSQPVRCVRFSGAIVSGPYSKCFMIDPMQHASIIGVHFKPGGAVPFFGTPANELANAHLDLETFWGRTAAELRERLCAAGSSAQRISFLENALVSRLRHRPVRHVAVSLALEMFAQTNGGARIREVASGIGLSQRRFIQVFAGEVGLTPKLYCRVRRFQQARELVRNLATPDWAGIAVDCGYYDQSHFVHDFREFSGLTPSAYFSRQSDLVMANHVPHAE